MKRLACWFVLLPSTAWAQYYNDGGSHQLDGPGDQVVVSSGTSLTVVAPATVTNGISVDATSGLTVEGGSILGSNAFGPGSTAGSGVTSQGIFSGTGGIITGGTCVDPGGHGGYGLISQGPTTISDGIYRGGGGYSGDGGVGGAGLSTTTRDLWISGGQFLGGNAAVGGVGALVSSHVDRVGHISGGYFAGRFSLVFYTTQRSSLEITGGSFEGDIAAVLTWDSWLTIKGTGLSYDRDRKLLSGWLEDGSELNVGFTGIGAYSVQQSSTEIRFRGASRPLWVPEPGSFILLSIAGLPLAAGIALRRWRTCCEQRHEAETPG